MRAEILTIGSELMNGATLNTNAAYLCRKLEELGIACQRQTAVADAPKPVVQAISESLPRCELLILTGGLGPTFDDMTMEAVACATRQPLIFKPKTAKTIRRFYARHNRKLQQEALRQALLPKTGQPLPNPIGTAPGLWLKMRRNILVALPGVPSEMRAIMERSVVPKLRRLPGHHAIVSCTLRTAGLVELDIQRFVSQMRIPKAVMLGLYPSLRMVDVRLTATANSKKQAEKLLRPLIRTLRRKLGSACYAIGEETLEGAIGRLLLQNRQTLAVAESCTGGLVSSRLTDVAGSSRYVRGAVVAYHNDIKQGALGVDRKLLKHHGAVSVAVARQMAAGIRKNTGSDIGLSVTGIAGPGGATAKKPVGLVYIGLADPKACCVWRHRFFGDRVSIKTQAAQTALNHLRLRLMERPLKPSSGSLK